jgi:DNA primase
LNSNVEVIVIVHQTCPENKPRSPWLVRVEGGGRFEDSRSTVEAVKARLDLRELGVRRKGAGWLCPFHEDREPSLGITARGFRCFACGATGDAFTLTQHQRSESFREALEWLATRAGVLLPARHHRPQVFQPPPPEPPRPPPENAPPTGVSFERRVEILTQFCRAARLAESHPYLERRGISFETAARAGVAVLTKPYDVVSRRLKELFPLPDLQAAGLFNDKGNCRLFRHRLLWPYWLDGRVYALQARNTDWRDKADGPKELDLTPVLLLYNADALADAQECVHVAEGVIDCLSLLETDLQAVAVPGASSFRPEWVEWFDLAGEVVLALDADDAGRRGAAAIAAHFRAAGRAVKVLRLPPGVKDVNELLLAEGGGA